MSGHCQHVKEGSTMQRKKDILDDLLVALKMICGWRVIYILSVYCYPHTEAGTHCLRLGLLGGQALERGKRALPSRGRSLLNQG